jgi:hypothetical protein
MDEIDNTSLERGASNDITRLRWSLKIRENIIGRLLAENERLRITEDERSALFSVMWIAEDYPHCCSTLRKLLARLS